MDGGWVNLYYQPSKLEVFPGTHFEIYGKGRKQTIKMAIEWFDKHLYKKEHR
jgi:hypothetical protein